MAVELWQGRFGHGVVGRGSQGRAVEASSVELMLGEHGCGIARQSRSVAVRNVWVSLGRLRFGSHGIV